MHRPDSAGGRLMQYFEGRSASRRSLEDLLLGQLELHLQPRPLRCGRRSRPKEFARGPPGMAIEDVPFKRAVRASMPPHVEKSLFHHPQPSSASWRTAGAALIDLFQLCPSFPGVPFRNAPSFLQGRYPVQARVMGPMTVKRSEPAQIIGTATALPRAEPTMPRAGDYAWASQQRMSQGTSVLCDIFSRWRAVPTRWTL
jgi:hypothetical protein